MTLFRIISVWSEIFATTKGAEIMSHSDLNLKVAPHIWVYIVICAYRIFWVLGYTESRVGVTHHMDGLYATQVPTIFSLIYFAVSFKFIFSVSWLFTIICCDDRKYKKNAKEEGKSSNSDFFLSLSFFSLPMVLSET